MHAFVEIVEVKKTQAGKDYLVLNVNDGVQKDSFCVWNPPSDFVQSKLKDKVVTVDLTIKGEFKSCSYRDLFITDIENEQEGSPLKNIKFRSDVTKEDFVRAINACSKLFTHPKFNNFLKFVNPVNLADVYGDTPAALKIHHALKGGLIEHTYEILSVYYQLAKSSLAKNLHHEFAVFAIMFHDYGKTLEYNLDNWESTEMYPLLGHVYYSAHTLHCLLDRYNQIIKRGITDGFHEVGGLEYSEDMIISERHIQCMVHCILAHHGRLEWGSPVVPAIKEAFAVHFLDNLSGDFNQITNAQNMEKSFFLNTRVVKDY